jgi:hypothetical protein
VECFPNSLENVLGAQDIVLDIRSRLNLRVTPEKWVEFYVTALKNLQPRVTEFVIHQGFDDEELRAATRERDTWGLPGDSETNDFFTSDQFREILVQQNIKVIT